MINSYIADYAVHGYTVFPLHGKVPVKGCEWRKVPYTATPDIQQFTNCNYGIVLSDDILIVDVDPRNFPKGRNSLKELRRDLMPGKIETYFVRTGSGGAHIYFKKPKGPVKKNLPQYPGIDFLTYGRYVVGPGSVHPETGRMYEIVSGSLDHIQTAPVKLLAEILQHEREAKDLDRTFETTDPQTRQRFMLYLSDIQPAIEGQAGDETTYKAACYGYTLGLSEAECLNIMFDTYNPRCIPPWPHETLALKVANAYKYAKGQAGERHPAVEFKDVELAPETEVLTYDFDGNKQLKKTLKNAVNVMISQEVGLNDLVRFNDFTKDIEFIKRAPWHATDNVRLWSDSDSIKLKYFLSQGKQFEVPINTLEEAIVIVSSMNAYHPIKDYLQALKWDGVPRIDDWLSKYLGVEDSPYTRIVGRKVLIAACKRVYFPGYKFDYMLVIEGDQGIGKSTACKILGGEWYGDFHIDPGNKDTVQAMNGKWICEVSEMECQTRYESNSLKAFISREIDRVRLPYGRHVKELPRQCIFIGTINPDIESSYLKDATGNRRYWPVFARYVKMSELLLDRDQLFAEAFHYMKKGEVLHLDREQEALAQVEQNARTPSDPWQDIIVGYLSRDVITGEPVQRLEVTSLEIWRHAIGGSDKAYDRLSQKRIAQIMVGALRWEPYRMYQGASRVSAFRRKVIATKPLIEFVNAEKAKMEMGL